MNKQWVGMGHDVCPVCGTEHNETLLLNRYMRDTLTNNEFAGFSLCPEHQAAQDDGYVFLVELRKAPQGRKSDLRSTWDLRTGNYAALRANVAAQVLGQSAPFSFCEIGVLARLELMSEGK